MDDRNTRYGRGGANYGPDSADRDYRSRDYAGRTPRDDDRWNERTGYGGQTRDWSGDQAGYSGESQGGGYGSQQRGGYGAYQGSNYGPYQGSTYGPYQGSGRGEHRDRGGAFQGTPRHYGQGQGGGRGYEGGRDEDRGFFERAGDEVRSWFGDEDAERRREQDQRYDERQGNQERWADRGHSDTQYHQWRRQRISELDRDYDEYRRENAQRFHNEFSDWRSERQGQRDSLGRVTEHMEVLGSDGTHVGTVDKVRGDRFILTKSDTAAGGHHHSIPSRWIQTVDERVTLRKTADEAKAHWKDEEGSGAMFGEGRGDEDRDADRNWRSGGNLNRSFPGTY